MKTVGLKQDSFDNNFFFLHFIYLKTFFYIRKNNKHELCSFTSQ